MPIEGFSDYITPIEHFFVRTHVYVPKVDLSQWRLPVKHGFPLRVIAPGWASDSWVKWVTNITVLDKEFDGFWMKSAYRKPDRPNCARVGDGSRENGSGDQPAREERDREPSGRREDPPGRNSRRDGRCVVRR
jgi:DMSO/TMAO reductase YedYZ molybdopterin-dependent catalytic subunit